MAPRPRSACRSDAKVALKRVRARVDKIDAELKAAKAEAAKNQRVADREVAMAPKTNAEIAEHNETVAAVKRQKKLDARVTALERRAQKAVGRLASATLKYDRLCGPGGGK